MILPFFPLKLVVFPGEELNLHIFEPRYKELIKDVEEGGLTFGVCTFIDQLSGYGTEVKLDEIHTRYEDGRMDIKTIVSVFLKLQPLTILHLIKDMPQVLSSGWKMISGSRTFCIMSIFFISGKCFIYCITM